MQNWNEHEEVSKLRTHPIYGGSDQYDPTSTFKPRDFFIDYPRIQLHQVQKLHQVQTKQDAQEIINIQILTSYKTDSGAVL